LPGSNTNAVAEYVMSALMHLRRPLTFGQLCAARLECRAPGGGQLHWLSTTTLGILGVGSRASFEISHATVSMTVLGNSRRKGALPAGIESRFKTCAARSDAIARSAAR
jgi:D-3-phosphoglycerate dehydrogenase